MGIDANLLLATAAIGVGATLAIDLWNLLLRRAFGLASLSTCVLGRWLCYMPSGVFRHASLAKAPSRPGECAIGLAAHYGIGVALAAGFLVLASAQWRAQPTMLPALAYGIATLVFPFFVMQPAFGLGIASARTPRPAQARLKSLGTHTVFGAGLYLCAWGVQYLQHLRP